MSGHREPPHYLKPLVSNSVPRRLLWLDCSATRAKVQGAFVQRWQVGALGQTHWTSRKRERRDDLQTFAQAAELWRTADTFCRAGSRTVLFSYDLPFQLRVSRALVELPSLGWQLTKIVLERQAAWAELKCSGRTLLMCDLRAWIPAELERIAADLGPRAALSAPARAGRPFQSDRALARAQTVREAVLDLLELLDRESLGPFRPTGSGQSYAAYRRRFMRSRLLVHDDIGRLALERAAMWTGRCEAWRHGRVDGAPLVEYDMHAAYCTIARDCAVPSQAVGIMHKPNRQRMEKAMATHAVLVHAQIETEVPCVPAKLGTRTAWPVGRFQTYLWDTELKLAYEYADKVTIYRGWQYQRDKALSDFASFVLERMQSGNDGGSQLQARLMKHWSRTLVGRMGLRYRTWERFGTTSEADLRLAVYIDWDDQTSTDLLTVGHQRMILTEMQESQESLPQIPSWIMSECRARLWQAMMTVGLDHVVYVDTDSMIIDNAKTYATIAEIGAATGLRWSKKGTYKTMTIYGPRNIVCETDRRVSGVPLTARQTAPLEFTGEVMRSIKESMRAGELDAVVSLPRVWHTTAPDLRREHLPYGATRPYRLEQ